MNSIHFVIKRLANIRKYLKQKGFLEKIALTDSTMFIFIQDIFPAYPTLLQSWYYKKKGKPLWHTLFSDTTFVIRENS